MTVTWSSLAVAPSPVILSPDTYRRHEWDLLTVMILSLCLLKLLFMTQAGDTEP